MFVNGFYSFIHINVILFQDFVLKYSLNDQHGYIMQKFEHKDKNPIVETVVKSGKYFQENIVATDFVNSSIKLYEQIKQKSNTIHTKHQFSVQPLMQSADTNKFNPERDLSVQSVKNENAVSLPRKLTIDSFKMTDNSLSSKSDIKQDNLNTSGHTESLFNQELFNRVRTQAEQKEQDVTTLSNRPSKLIGS